MERTFQLDDDGLREVKQHKKQHREQGRERGRQEERVLTDIVRLTSPGRQTIADIPMKTDREMMPREATRFLESPLNQKHFDNTPRRESERVGQQMLWSAVYDLKVGQTRTTRNGWTIEKVPSGRQLMGSYDPVRETDK